MKAKVVSVRSSQCRAGDGRCPAERSGAAAFGARPFGATTGSDLPARGSTAPANGCSSGKRYVGGGSGRIARTRRMVGATALSGKVARYRATISTASVAAASTTAPRAAPSPAPCPAAITSMFAPDAPHGTQLLTARGSVANQRPATE